MKKVITFLTTFTLSFSFLFAQAPEIVQITSGTSYKKQTFYSLATNATATINNTDWDIAFTVYGQQDAGVFLNEAAGVGTPPQNPIKVYKAPTDVFTDVIQVSALKDSLNNDETNWSYGAFNPGVSPSSPFNYGWGAYNNTTKLVEGSKVFVIKLRDGSFRKLEIQKLALTVYTFRHANLDGSDEKVVTVDKTKFAGKTFAYYSFASNKVSDLEPASGFDLLYTRYTSTVEQNGTILSNYPVLGVLTGRGIQVAKAAGIDPSKVKLSDYTSKFEKRADVIGYDWKSFDLATNTWKVLTDLVYFVKLKSEDIYKIEFIDFEGSATGTATFEKTYLGKLVVKLNEITAETNFKVFPTLATDNIQIAFDNKVAEVIELNISDMSGRLFSQNKMTIEAGFQVNTLNVSDLVSGTYVVTLKTSKGIATAKFIKQ
jgi:hypothetical protein